MKKVYFYNILKILISVTIFIFIFSFINKLLIKPNDAFKRRESFESLPKNSIDIIIIGNSHAYTTFIPEKINHITGMNTYNAAMPSQVLDLTYYNFKLSLKNQKPKIVVLEAFAFQDPSSRDVFNDSNIDSMGFSLTKLSAIFNIFKSPKDRFQLLSSIYRHHSNWSDSELVKDNLHKIRFGQEYSYVESGGYYKIESKMTPATVEKLKNMKQSEAVYKAKVTEYNKAYFDKIYKECKARDIKLIAVMAPMNKNFVDMTNYDSVHKDFKDLFDSYGVQFVDYNLLYNELNIKDEDFADETHNAHHVNYFGATKISDHFAKFLKAQ